MSFFRRLSRDRSSKGEQDLQMPIRAAPYSDSRDTRRDSNQALYKDTQYPSSPTSQDKLQSYRAQPLQDHIYNSSQRPPGTSSDATTHTAPTNMNLASAPDPLTKAFNEAIKPYVEQIDVLRNELDDTLVQVQQLEDERADMHAWIDKRGLRAGKSIITSSMINWPAILSSQYALTSSSPHRRPTPHRRSNEHRPLRCLDPKLPYRPQNDCYKRRPAPPTGQPHSTPPHLHLRYHSPHPPAGDRKPCLPSRRRVARL